MTTAADAIHEAMVALGGAAHVYQVRAWIDGHYAGRWQPSTIGTSMADLTYPGNRPSQYSESRQFLVREGDRYRLRDQRSAGDGSHASAKPGESRVPDSHMPSDRSPDLARVTDIYGRYVEARNALLAELNLGRNSNRDPLAEFAEWLVAALLAGKLAPSPVQAHWDVEARGVGKVQVKYLANSGNERWVNEHPVRVTDLMDAYAIVFYESLLPVSVILLPARRLVEVGLALGKRHPDQDTTLQLTRANYVRLIREPGVFRPLGVRTWRAPAWTEGEV
jgi:hypothetical protein